MRSLWANAAARRWAFRVALLVSLLGILVANGMPLWYYAHGQRVLIVTGGSMAPEIGAGDAVIIRPLEASELRVDQVVTFQAPGTDKYTTHRIIQIVQRALVQDAPPDANKQYFIRTQGDNNHTPDPNLTPIGSIRGIVVETMPGWGRFLTWSHSAEGRLVLFAPPLLLILGAELLSWWTPRRSRRREDEGVDQVAAPVLV